jgi:hypothetical protein
MTAEVGAGERLSLPFGRGCSDSDIMHEDMLDMVEWDVNA